MISLFSGKWTTFRKMAEDSVDRIIETTPALKARKSSSYTSTSTSPIGPCVSETIPLIGSAGWSLAAPSALVRQGLSESTATHLSHNYGDKAREVAAIATGSAPNTKQVRCTQVDVVTRRV
jgi:glycerol-3-phosphate dehydrogenase